ncbi:hypothetical protein HN784_00120 [bacterium]|jgi:dCMP deaminase|nr:hypothetical protein [bacterium]MBT4251015.1 hypothetical protein [bacterium]MBT4597753.1 hypothetical protein [bacterium]MBT6753848.1 hypothetical protein [bacterium]MBT7037440.1 hypothetical protein [bacterium]
MKRIIIAYVPVLHEGYRRFFEKYSDDVELWIIGQEVIEKFDYFYKEVRALKPELIVKSIESWGMFENIGILNKEKLKDLQKEEIEIIAPKEDVIKDVIKEYFLDKEITWDDIFLRWDKHNYTSKIEISPDLEMSQKEFDNKIMKLAVADAENSSDWWRRVSAVIVKDGKAIIIEHNKHVPSNHTPYANGDPRNAAHKGVNLELSTVLHAEAGAVARAAKQGISLEGAEIYVTTFPCPPCAKQIAYSGIKKVYYSSGYGVLDGETILKENGVKIVFVRADISPQKGLGDTKYDKPKK